VTADALARRIYPRMSFQPLPAGWVPPPAPVPSAEEMAARALMSVRTFSRRFKAATGTTPHAWLLRQRLARAEDMLERTDLSIDEVARLVGYASGSVMREQFLKRHGVPPREYRRMFGTPGRPLAVKGQLTASGNR
jgi:AraC-like DNA-binding protein